MSSKSWPHDATGNEIRKGDQVLVELGKPVLIVEVLEVEAAADITAPNGQSMPTQGKLILGAMIPVPYSPDQFISNMYVLKKPDLVQVPGARLGPGLVKPS